MDNFVLLVRLHRVGNKFYNCLVLHWSVNDLTPTTGWLGEKGAELNKSNYQIVAKHDKLNNILAIGALSAGGGG